MSPARFWTRAVPLLVLGVIFVPSAVMSSTCYSWPMTHALYSLRSFRLAQEEFRKGIPGFGNPGGKTGYWRKDIRGLEDTVVQGKPAGLIGRNLADSDVGKGGANVALPDPEISLRALTFAGEPPLDYRRYAVVLWVDDPAIGSWTLIQSQDGTWGKRGRIALDCFPSDPDRDEWLTESQIWSIRKWSKEWNEWLRFWKFRWL